MIALFSVANEYDQPRNNLVCLWKDKPSLETLCKDLGWKFPSDSDEDTLAIVNLWQGKEVRIGNTDYRLETVHFNKKLEC